MYESGGGDEKRRKEGRKWREKPFWSLIISRKSFLTLKTNASFSGRNGKNGHNTICSLSE